MIIFFNNIDAFRFLNNIEIVNFNINLNDRVKENIHNREIVNNIQIKNNNNDLINIMCNDLHNDKKNLNIIHLCCVNRNVMFC